MPPGHITFSGPAKRDHELARAVEIGIGELVIENLAEARIASEHARKRGRVQDCLVRINPFKIPRGFGASMAALPSQFGFDEEKIDSELPAVQALPGLRIAGFHIYSGTNCLDADAIAENFEIFAKLFRYAQETIRIPVEKLIFGAGFGIPYLPDEQELAIDELPGLVNPIVDALLAEDAFRAARCQLELGRWLVGPAGWLVTRVITAKSSRGSEIRACDAGFNNHLAACGMMGSVIRRNWVFENLTRPDGDLATYTLVGPLCTTIDRLAFDIELPEVRVGDLLAIPQSGAYGFSASPNRFISHPDPVEIVVFEEAVIEASEPVNPGNARQD
jgi:diaminopimelate decarboxylase